MSTFLLSICTRIASIPARTKPKKEQHKNHAKHLEEQKKRRRNKDKFHAQLKIVLDDLDKYCGSHKDIFTPTEFLSFIKVDGEDFGKRHVSIYLPEKMVLRYEKSKRFLGVNHKIHKPFHALIVVRNFDKWHKLGFFEQQQEAQK